VRAINPLSFLVKKPAASDLATMIRWLGVFTPVAIVAGPSPADIVCSAVAALFLIHAAWRREFAWLRQDWLIVSLALWAYLCLRALFAPDVTTSLALALPFVRYVIFAAALQSLVLTEATWRQRLALVTIACLSVLAIDALLQYVTGRDILGNALHQDRIVAFHRHPWVGTKIAWLFLPATLMLVDHKRFLLAAGFGALFFVVILLSGDRMALLLSLFEIGLLGLLFRKARRVFLMALLPGAAILAAILYFSPDVYRRQVVSSIELVKNLPKSPYGIIWTSALKMSRDHPLFGVGPRAFRDVCPDPKYGPLYPHSSPEPRCATHPHNFYLEWLVESGLVGLALFVAAMALVVRQFLFRLGRAPPDWVFAGLFVTLLARLWPLASSTSFHHAWSGVPFWLVVGWGLSYAVLTSTARTSSAGGEAGATLTQSPASVAKDARANKPE
jgi:O-antigen ligase